MSTPTIEHESSKGSSDDMDIDTSTIESASGSQPAPNVNLSSLSFKSSSLFTSTDIQSASLASDGLIQLNKSPAALIEESNSGILGDINISQSSLFGSIAPTICTKSIQGSSLFNSSSAAQPADEAATDKAHPNQSSLVASSQITNLNTLNIQGSSLFDSDIPNSKKESAKDGAGRTSNNKQSNPIILSPPPVQVLSESTFKAPPIPNIADLRSVGSINASQSTLFGTDTQSATTHSINSIHSDASSLSDSASKGSKLFKTPQMELNANHDPIQNSNVDDEVEISYQVDVFQPTLKPKEVKLLTGEMLTLKTRIKKKTDIKMTNKESVYGVNINHLFNRIEIEKLTSKESNNKANASKNNVLWAEKWRPNKFIDLVGNEKTNRYVLRWLRTWSGCVFGESVIPKDKNKISIDPFDRPDRKILLIHGPPGIGKTTVAHVIAKQAGYDIMEINASDERAGQKVKDKVLNSLSSVTFSGKPTCLIADEIDGGAESGFIKVLVDIINNDNRSILNHNKRSIDQNNKKKKPKFLMRPIIAICNDLYSPVLEKLRPHAEIISFRKSSERTVKERLRTICSSEKLTLSAKDIQDIVEVTNCDIRSCLNILQFGGGTGNGADSQTSRRKDTQVNWFSIVNQIFKRNPTMSKEEQFDEILSIIETNSNYDKVVNGCFNLYLETPYQDDLFQKPSSISDWLYFNDLMSSSLYEQNGELVPYCGQVAMKFFQLFSEINKNVYKIKSDYGYFEKAKHNKETINRVLDKLPVDLRLILKTSDLPTDFLPYLSKILNPDTKSSKSNIKEQDKRKIEAIVNLVKTFNFQVEQLRDESHLQILTLTPNFDSLTMFNELILKQLVNKRLVLLPIISQELEKLNNLNTLKRPLKEVHIITEKNEPSKVSKSGSTIEFFKGKYSKTMIEPKKQRNESTRIWVKYNEGFSNAVRRNITWDDLWD